MDLAAPKDVSETPDDALSLGPVDLAETSLVFGAIVEASEEHVIDDASLAAADDHLFGGEAEAAADDAFDAVIIGAYLPLDAVAGLGAPADAGDDVDAGADAIL